MYATHRTILALCVNFGIITCSDNHTSIGQKRPSSQEPEVMRTPPAKVRKEISSPYTTPPTGSTYCTQNRSITDIIGISRLRQKAGSADDRQCVLVTPFLTSDAIKDEILSNHYEGIAQTVIVGYAAARSASHGKHIIAQLHDAGIDVRVGNIHTKAVYRSYRDANGVLHCGRFTGTSNLSNQCHRNFDYMETVSSLHTSTAAIDFDADIKRMREACTPYGAYMAHPKHYRYQDKRVAPVYRQPITSCTETRICNSRFHDVVGKKCESVDSVSAGGSIIVFAYTFNDHHFLNSLSRAVQRGVHVTVYCDRKHITQKLRDYLGNALIPVQPRRGIQHMKSVICHDPHWGSIMLTGSRNHTSNNMAQHNQVKITKDTSTIAAHQNHITGQLHHALQADRR